MYVHRYIQMYVCMYVCMEAKLTQAIDDYKRYAYFLFVDARSH